ncbi:MAG: NifU family protein [Bacteroidales bacterium]|nr:NifU family protein [Bacteroidales bacterium]MBN2817980.1 NifU family protein [Bacteroidales bacterium]
MANKITQEDLDKINKAIESVRPYLVTDGGDVELVEVTDDKVVKVRLLGACEGCPFSMMTLKAGIEQSIRKEWPKLTSLESV